MQESDADREKLLNLVTGFALSNTALGCRSAPSSDPTLSRLRLAKLAQRVASVDTTREMLSVLLASIWFAEAWLADSCTWSAYIGNSSLGSSTLPPPKPPRMMKKSSHLRVAATNLPKPGTENIPRPSICINPNETSTPQNLKEAALCPSRAEVRTVFCHTIAAADGTYKKGFRIGPMTSMPSRWHTIDFHSIRIFQPGEQSTSSTKSQRASHTGERVEEDLLYATCPSVHSPAQPPIHSSINPNTQPHVSSSIHPPSRSATQPSSHLVTPPPPPSHPGTQAPGQPRLAIPAQAHTLQPPLLKPTPPSLSPTISTIPLPLD